MAYVFAAIVGFAALAVALLMALRRLKTSEERIANAVTRKQAQVERIKRVARTTLHLAQDLRDAKRRRNAIEFACEELEQKLKASGATERRIYVLDDRRTQADTAWLVRIVNTEYSSRVNSALEKSALESWKRGRRFLVWALDEKKVREKVNARYPEHKGFALMSVEAHRW